MTKQNRENKVEKKKKQTKTATKAKRARKMNKFHVFQYQRCSVFAASFHANVVCIAVRLNENETKKNLFNFSNFLSA